MNRFLAIIGLVVLLFGITVTVLASSATVQIPASGWDYLGGEDSPATWSRLGQRFTLEDTEVLAIGYRLCRVGSPTGDVTLSIRDSSTDHVIWSQVWGDASSLPKPNDSIYITLNITPSVIVDGDVRICAEYRSGNATDYVQAGYYSGDKITGQWYTNYVNYSADIDGWHDIGEAEEAAYYMLYEGGTVVPTDGGNDPVGGFNWWVTGAILGIVATVIVGGFLLRKPKG